MDLLPDTQKEVSDLLQLAQSAAQRILFDPSYYDDDDSDYLRIELLSLKKEAAHALRSASEQMEAIRLGVMQCHLFIALLSFVATTALATYWCSRRGETTTHNEKVVQASEV